MVGTEPIVTDSYKQQKINLANSSMGIFEWMKRKPCTIFSLFFLRHFNGLDDNEGKKRRKLNSLLDELPFWKRTQINISLILSFVSF